IGGAGGGFRVAVNPTSPNIVGGFSGSNGNTVTAGVVGAMIGGGGSTNFGNRVSDNYGTIGGGQLNRAGNDLAPTNEAVNATGGGGFQNAATGANATGGGGDHNLASGSGAFVGGGSTNQATGSLFATVSGGFENIASGIRAAIGGGDSNVAGGDDATV